MCDKINDSDKHKKYIDFYKDLNNMKHNGTVLFWGIGIENETYLMTEKMDSVTRNFLMNNTKRERYSIDYFSNYNMEEYKKTVSKVEKATVPYYINGYMFQNMDIHGENKTLYTKGIKLNNKYCGMSIHEYMKYVSNKYKKLFDNNVIFDGDTIEFTTNNFYKTTVDYTINELKKIKNDFLREVNTYLANKFVFSGYGSAFHFPSYNYGFVKYMTNKNNIGICNSGTYHINITLPTELSLCGMKIKDPIAFKNKHRNAIRLIQWVEPLIIALYGTPDILSCIDNGKRYSKGSLRLMMSRYIGLGTYDTDKMEPGKKLNDFIRPPAISDIVNKLNENISSVVLRDSIRNGVDTTAYGGVIGDTPVYNLPHNIGYDFNYNKFKNHGIELRILDYFPEDYLKDVINFLILVCRHSTNIVPKTQHSTLWNNFANNCIINGSETIVSNEMYLLFREIFGMDNDCCLFNCRRQNKNITIIKVITKISDFLYDKYHDDDMIVKMSPSMKRVIWVDYNKIIREKYLHSITR
jgi:hypothetical protein